MIFPRSNQILFIFLFGIQSIGGEIFTSALEVQKLSDVEDMFVNNLKNYVSTLEEKVVFLKKEINFYEQHQSDKVVNDLSNPVEAFRVIKRLTFGKKKLASMVLTNGPEELLDKIKSLDGFPTDEDLKGATFAIRRLQKTYNLNTTNVANGLVNGLNSRSRMTADDCYQLGKFLMSNNDYELAAEWMQQALDRYDKFGTSELSEVDMLRNLIMAHDMDGNAIAGLGALSRLVKLTPNDPQIDIFKTKMEDAVAKGLNEKTLDYPAPVIDRHQPLRYDQADKNHYEKLCRSEIKPTPAQLAPLRCRLVTNNQPIFRIGPLKMEEMSLEPDIVIYHNVLYDSEIEILKALSLPTFQRSEIYSGTLDELRVSKTSWVGDSEHEQVAKVSQRVQDITGLSIRTAEAFQVLNYGLAGHYEPHFDWAGDKSVSVLEHGNRIATFLFYMSDEMQGGATVFPYANVTVWPERGSAVLWYNLHRSCKGDIRTKHAACPVIAGTKWAANKWLHVVGQELIRPCDLRPDHLEGTNYDN